MAWKGHHLIQRSVEHSLVVQGGISKIIDKGTVSLLVSAGDCDSSWIFCTICEFANCGYCFRFHVWIILLLSLVYHWITKRQKLSPWDNLGRILAHRTPNPTSKKHFYSVAVDLLLVLVLSRYFAFSTEAICLENRNHCRQKRDRNVLAQQNPHKRLCQHH